MVILTVIFRQLDIPRFIEMLRGMNVWLLILGLLAYPGTVLIGAMRWYQLLQLYFKQPVPFGFVLRHYYIGLAIGLFSPASTGWDIYRVVAAGRRLGLYGVNIAAIVVEKIMAVLAMVTAIVILYPLVRDRLHLDSPVLLQALLIAYAAAIIMLVFAGIMILCRKQSVVSLLAKRVDALGRTLLTNLRLTVPPITGAVQTEAGFLEYVAQPFTTIGPFLAVLGLSLCIQSISSVSGYFMFLALGNPVPMLINLFVTPLMLFLFMLPMSFGSVGIREGAHILLFGLFGVSSEVALAVSCIGLVGLLLNQAIGAMFIWFHNHEATAAITRN